jgi:hypothetical protein
MNAGAIGGIVAGVLVVIMLIVGVVVGAQMKRRKAYATNFKKAMAATSVLDELFTNTSRKNRSKRA